MRRDNERSAKKKQIIEMFLLPNHMNAHSFIDGLYKTSCTHARTHAYRGYYFLKSDKKNILEFK